MLVGTGRRRREPHPPLAAASPKSRDLPLPSVLMREDDIDFNLIERVCIGLLGNIGPFGDFMLNGSQGWGHRGVRPYTGQQCQAKTYSYPELHKLSGTHIGLFLSSARRGSRCCLQIKRQQLANDLSILFLVLNARAPTPNLEERASLS